MAGVTSEDRETGIRTGAMQDLVYSIEPTATTPPSLASEAPFPYDDPTVAYLIAVDGKIEQVRSLAWAQARALQGFTIYAVWPGKWTSSLFICDDLPPADVG